MCCDMLDVVGSSLKMVKFEATTPNTLQHVVRNNVALCCGGMLRLFGGGLSYRVSDMKIAVGYFIDL